MLRGDKGARDLFATAQENILELPAGDPAMEIDIDTRENLRVLHGHSIDMRLSGNAGEIFFPAHGLRKLRAQLCINVTRIEWTPQKNQS
jgi:hypothetical protein